MGVCAYCKKDTGSGGLYWDKYNLGFCSVNCQTAYGQSQSSGDKSSKSSDGGGSGAAGAIGSGVGGLLGGIGAGAAGFGNFISSTMDAKVEEEKDERNQMNELRARVNGVKVEGNTDEMSNSLNEIFSIYGSINLGSSWDQLGDTTVKDKKGFQTTLLEKAEFGIMKLRKVDGDMADYFQKKLDDIRNPPKKGLFGFGKKK